MVNGAERKLYGDLTPVPPAAERPLSANGVGDQVHGDLTPSPSPQTERGVSNPP
jgi:hypothetical protein